MLLLPEVASPVLTRELIYTAVTRARRQVAIWGSEEVLREALVRSIARSSGLLNALRDAWR